MQRLLQEIPLPELAVFLVSLLDATKSCQLVYFWCECVFSFKIKWRLNNIVCPCLLPVEKNLYAATNENEQLSYLLFEIFPSALNQAQTMLLCSILLLYRKIMPCRLWLPKIISPNAVWQQRTHRQAIIWKTYQIGIAVCNLQASAEKRTIYM